jgi:hypothetical protein
MSATAHHDSSTDTLAPAAAEGEVVRCFECRQLWPRHAMRWGARPSGPVWFPRTVRVQRCPDCLPG